MKRTELYDFDLDTDNMPDVAIELGINVYWTFARFAFAIAVEGVVSGEG